MCEIDLVWPVEELNLQDQKMTDQYILKYSIGLQYSEWVLFTE